MANVPTPHINAKEGDFAKTVLMPGDPLRAKFIAENYLEDAKQVTDVRNMLGFTGTYKGKRVSVMGDGVENIIRIGSAGSMSDKCDVMDIVIAQGACTNSAWQTQYGFPGTYAPIGDFELLYNAVETAKKQGTKVVVGNILSSDTFYNALPEPNKTWMEMGVLCVEMEAAALYMEAAKSKKKALAILTISDNILTGKELTSEERQIGFRKMMELALGIA